MQFGFIRCDLVSVSMPDLHESNQKPARHAKTGKVVLDTNFGEMLANVQDVFLGGAEFSCQLVAGPAEL